MKFPFFAAENDLLARVQSSFVQTAERLVSAAARLPVRLFGRAFFALHRALPTVTESHAKTA